MHTIARYGCVGLALVFPLLADAACPDQDTVAAYVADFQAARTSLGFGNDLSLTDAECAKAKLVHFGSIGLIPEQSCAATLDAVDAARSHGLHV